MSLQIPVDAGTGRAADGYSGTIVQAAAPRPYHAGSKGDVERTAGALRRAVEAEGLFRSIVDDAQPGRVQEAAQRFGKVPHAALAGTSDPLEQAALIGQLDQGMAFHEDRLALRVMQDRAQEMAQLRDERLKGMLRDASDAGGMAGSAMSPELRQRAFMHFSNTMLSMEQTFRATGKILGEGDSAVGERIRASRSGMTGAFVTRMAQDNPIHAKALLGQLNDVLDEEDRKRVGESIAQSVQDRAVASLETDHHDGERVDYDKALSSLVSRSGSLGLEAKDRAAVRERLQIARARQEYQKGKTDDDLRKKTFTDFYSSVDAGDVVAAHRMLDEDTLLTESQRVRMRASLKHEKWETVPKPFLKLFDKLETGKLDNGLEIIPGSDLSSRDAVLLRDVIRPDAPRAVMENRLLFRSAKAVLDDMRGEKDERKAEAVRAMFGALSEARRKGEDPVILFTPGKEGNIIDHMFRVYGTSGVHAGNAKEKPEADTQQTVDSGIAAVPGQRKGISSESVLQVGDLKEDRQRKGA